jgi:hypothetical protein
MNLSGKRKGIIYNNIEKDSCCMIAHQVRKERDSKSSV